MKYSISGSVFTGDGSKIISTINRFTLWKLDVTQSIDVATEQSTFNFEVWVNSEIDKTALFDELKVYVVNHGGYINWHECSHDEDHSTPCTIAEEYRGD